MPKSDTNNSIKADYNNKATSASFVFTVRECAGPVNEGRKYLQNEIKSEKKKDR